MRRFAMLVVLVALVPQAAAAATLNETIDRTIDVRPGANVLLSNVNGSIRVGSWDQAKVRVVAYKEVKGDRDEVADVLRELRVDIQPREGGVVVTTHYPRRAEGLASIFSWLLGEHIQAQVRYEVTVPRRMNVRVGNTNGAIQLADVTGEMRLDTTNGRITVTRCAGSLDASTTNGGIEAELTSVAKGQPMRFETTNGRITLTLPRDFPADLDADTTNGRISTDIPIATTSLSRNSLRGTLNGGGTMVRLRTTNGGIEIRAAGKS